VDYIHCQNQLAGWSILHYVTLAIKSWEAHIKESRNSSPCRLYNPTNLNLLPSPLWTSTYPGRLITQYTTRFLTILWLRNQLRPKRLATQSDAFASDCPYWSIVLWLSLSRSLAINQHSHWYASTGVQLTPRDWQDAYIEPEGAM
jgi:hypothetical protein